MWAEPVLHRTVGALVQVLYQACSHHTEGDAEFVQDILWGSQEPLLMIGGEMLVLVFWFPGLEYAAVRLGGSCQMPSDVLVLTGDIK